MAIQYTKAFLDMQSYHKSGRIHSSVFPWYSFHVQNWPQAKNLKIPTNSGKFPWQVIGPFPSYQVWILNQLDTSTNGN